MSQLDYQFSATPTIGTRSEIPTDVSSQNSSKSTIYPTTGTNSIGKIRDDRNKASKHSTINSSDSRIILSTCKFEFDYFK